MVKYLVVEAKDGDELSRKLEELTREQSGIVQGFSYNAEKGRYASLLCFPSEQFAVTVLPLTPEEVKSIERNNVLVLWEQNASKREISDYLGISDEEVSAFFGKAKRKN